MDLISRLNLRKSLGLLVGILVSGTVGGVAGVFIYSLNTNLEQANASKAHVMQDALRRKGETVTRNVALSSGRGLLTGNFSFLLEVVSTTVANDNELVYGMLVDKQGYVIVHSDQSQSNQQLTQPGDLQMAKATALVVRDALFAGHPILEVVAPIQVAEEPWGVARFGLSLARVRTEIELSEARAGEQVRSTIFYALAVVIVLTLLAIYAGIRSANFLIQPLQGLLNAAHRLSQGDRSDRVQVRGSREFQTLGRAFNEMTDAVHMREVALHAAVQEAREANRHKSEFLANVSHELRTPLNAIINIPSALTRDYRSIYLWHCPQCDALFHPEPETLQSVDTQVEHCLHCNTQLKLESHVECTGTPSEHLQLLHRNLQSAKHLLAVVSDILDFSKLEAGKMTVHLEPTPVHEVIEVVNNTVAVLAAPKHIELVWPTLDASVQLHADPIKLSQVLLNVVGNAIKFTPENGKVDITFSQDPTRNEACFTVSDTGPGIPANKIGQLFESFRQVDGSHTRAHGGTGLGLSISRKLVELHGGRIWAESVEGQGSRFFITLPVLQVARQAEGGKRYAGRVLVVDDDAMQLELVDQFLRNAGYEVECMTNAATVTTTLEAHPVALLILDVMMPGTSGLTVMQELRGREKTKDVPIIVSSAYHMNKDLVQNLGGTWLPKPWTEEQLIQCVATCAPHLAVPHKEA